MPGWLVYVLAVVGLGVACALWVALQLRSDDPAKGVAGGCGACSERESCRSDACDVDPEGDRRYRAGSHRGG